MLGVLMNCEPGISNPPSPRSWNNILHTRTVRLCQGFIGGVSTVASSVELAMDAARFVVALRFPGLDRSIQRFASSSSSPSRSTSLRRSVLARDELSSEELGISIQQQEQQMGLEDTPMESTAEHKLWVLAGSTAVAATLVKSAAAAAAPLAIGGGVCGYILADLATGVYHWAIDNYGDASTPVFGAQIDAFQGHHLRPSTITRRQFANNIAATSKPAAIALAPLLLLAPPNAGVDSFVGVFVACVVLSQQFHAWAHTRRSDLPPAVAALQDMGLLVATKMHTRHHRSPYSCDYCIVSGLCNRFLDSNRVFRRLELWIHKNWRIAPRCWLLAK